MKDKNIKERYNKTINIFMNSIVEREESTTLKIEKIEKIEEIKKEYDEYNKKVVKDKLDFGTMILAGTALTVIATKLLLKDTNYLELEDLFSILLGALGTSTIPISIDNYRKDRLNSNIDANKSLKEYEEIIEKEKLNVKKR